MSFTMCEVIVKGCENQYKIVESLPVSVMIQYCPEIT